DDGPFNRRRVPPELGDRAAVVLVVLEFDVVTLARLQRDGAAIGARGMIVPLVDELLAVDPEAHTVVADGRKGVCLARRRLHLSRPAYRERGPADSRRGCAPLPVEAHR